MLRASQKKIPTPFRTPISLAAVEGIKAPPAGEGVMIDLSNRGRCLRYQSRLAVECAHAAERPHFTNAAAAAAVWVPADKTRGRGQRSNNTTERQIHRYVTSVCFVSSHSEVCVSESAWAASLAATKRIFASSDNLQCRKKGCSRFQFALSMPARTHRLLNTSELLRQSAD